MAKGSIGFRESTAAYASLSKEIAARRFAPVYLLMGEEGYFIDRLSEMLATSVLGEAERTFSQIVAYGKDSDAGQIINFCRQVPMMGDYQVVILREAQQLRELDRLSLYTQSPSASTILVICHKDKNLDKRSQLYKHVAQKGTVFESVRPRDYEIGPWLSDFVRSKGHSIEPAALTILTDHLGVDIARISNEMDKLTAFLPQGTAKITADHIETNIGISKEFNNYELTRAISAGDRNKALMIASHFARNPRENPLLVTVSALFTHFQRIFLLHYTHWAAARKGAPAPSDADLCKALKVSSPFFLKEYRQAAARYPNKKVFAILGMLREYDMKSKGMNSGNAADGELLRELLLKIFMI